MELIPDGPLNIANAGDLPFATIEDPPGDAGLTIAFHLEKQTLMPQTYLARNSESPVRQAYLE